MANEFSWLELIIKMWRDDTMGVLTNYSRSLEEGHPKITCSARFAGLQIPMNAKLLEGRRIVAIKVATPVDMDEHSKNTEWLNQAPLWHLEKQPVWSVVNVEVHVCATAAQG